MRFIGTIEARMGSSRLPGKTLMEIQPGLTLLGLVCRRFQLCYRVDDIVVATTVSPKDDAIVEFCEEHGINYWRGDEENVLDRVVGAAKSLDADVIVQMGADSGYLDYRMIDDMVAKWGTGYYDYLCNDLTLTYPLGIYAHLVRVETLKKLNARTDLSHEDREDVVRYIFEHPGQFCIKSLEAPTGLRCPELRLTIDYPEDFEQLRDVIEHFGHTHYSTMQLVRLFGENPKMFARTKNLVQLSAPFLEKSHD